MSTGIIRNRLGVVSCITARSYTKIDVKNERSASKQDAIEAGLSCHAPENVRLC